MALIDDDVVEHGVRVRVSLPQYGNLSGSLGFTEEEQPAIIRGRIVAALVKEAVTSPLGAIDLSFVREDVDHHKLFTEQLHVRAVLRHLAGSLEMSVQDLYSQLQWPSYDDLASSPDRTFWLSVPENLKAPLPLLWSNYKVTMALSNFREQRAKKSY